MPRTSNILFRTVTGLAALAIFLAVLFAVVDTKYVTTAQDARASEQIRSEFEQAIRAAAPAEKRVTATISPRRNGTFIIVTGASLTKKEKESMALQAKEISRKHDNRQISIVFRN